MKKIFYILMILLAGTHNCLAHAQCALVNATNYALPTDASIPLSVTFSPDGTLLATANANSDDVSLFNVSGNMLIGGINYPLPSPGDTPFSITFSPDKFTLSYG